MTQKINNTDLEVTLVVDPDRFNVTDFITGLPDESVVKMKNGEMNVIMQIEDALEQVERLSLEEGINEFAYNRATKTISVS
jgi:hypothetical protein